MGRSRGGVLPDAQRLTERIQRGEGGDRPVIAAEDLRANKVLAGVGATYGHITGRPCTQAARFIIRDAVNDGAPNEIEDRLHALGLDWYDACPIPNPGHPMKPGGEPDPEPAPPDATRYKRCARCENYQQRTDFSADAGAKDGLQSYCRACHNSINAAYRKTLGDTEKVLPGTQRCCTCKETLHAVHFSLDRSTKAGLARRCRECKSQRDRQEAARRRKRRAL